MWDGDRWYCEVCEQRVLTVGPWCTLYRQERHTICRPLMKQLLKQADASGDGPMVNVLCALGRKKYGQDIDW